MTEQGDGQRLHFLAPYSYSVPTEWLVLCQENGHVKQREIAEPMQLLFSD
jgi:hypothetical protein